MTLSQRHKVFILLMASTALSVLAFFALLIAHVYVRWAVNQNFSFLPGFGFESVAVLTLGQLVGLAYLSRGEK